MMLYKFDYYYYLKSVMQAKMSLEALWHMSTNNSSSTAAVINLDRRLHFSRTECCYFSAAAADYRLLLF